MSQHDLDIANQTASVVRADINSALQALGSTNSGPSAPATTYANMLWYDTTNNTLKMRTEANDAWISIGYMDQAADAFRIFEGTQVVNTSGTPVALISSQANSTWTAGTSTVESLVSPAKVKASVLANAPSVITGSGTAQIGTLKIAWGITAVPAGGSAFQTLPFTYSSTSSFGVVAMSEDGDAPGATRAAQGVTITATNQIKLAHAQFGSNNMHWYTIGY